MRRHKRLQPERVVLTMGTFSPPHIGHAILLHECERYGDWVVVGVNSDEFVEQYKGFKPEYSYEEREYLIRMLGYEVIKNSSAGRDCIEQVKPDVIAIGSDWATKDYYKQIDVTQDYLDQNNITMIYIPRVGTISSTELRQRL